MRQIWLKYIGPVPLKDIKCRLFRYYLPLKKGRDPFFEQLSIPSLKYFAIIFPWENIFKNKLEFTLPKVRHAYYREIKFYNYGRGFIPDHHLSAL